MIEINEKLNYFPVSPAIEALVGLPNSGKTREALAHANQILTDNPETRALFITLDERVSHIAKRFVDAHGTTNLGRLYLYDSKGTWEEIEKIIADVKAAVGVTYVVIDNVFLVKMPEEFKDVPHADNPYFVQGVVFAKLNEAAKKYSVLFLVTQQRVRGSRP